MPKTVQSTMQLYSFHFPGGSDGKVSAYHARGLGSIPGSGRSPGEGNGNPFQYSCLEKSHGQRSLVGYSAWGRKQSDTTERLHFTSHASNVMLKILQAQCSKFSNVGLKLNIQKTNIMAFGPITSWQIDGQTMEIVTDFIFGGFKITADGDCSHEIKRHLLLGRKAMTNLDRILKNRDITLPKNVHLVKAMFFPVVMYGCESWTIMKAEHRRIDAFELWCWRRLLRGPWTAKRSNQAILKEISPGCSLEGLMLKLKLQLLHLMWRTDSFEKTLMLGSLRAGGEVDDRGWDG